MINNTQKLKTLLSAFEQYNTLKGGHFDLTIKFSFIYHMSD